MSVDKFPNVVLLLLILASTLATDEYIYYGPECPDGQVSVVCGITAARDAPQIVRLLDRCASRVVTYILTDKSYHDMVRHVLDRYGDVVELVDRTQCALHDSIVFTDHDERTLNYACTSSKGNSTTSPTVEYRYDGFISELRTPLSEVQGQLTRPSASPLQGIPIDD